MSIQKMGDDKYTVNIPTVAVTEGDYDFLCAQLNQGKSNSEVIHEALKLLKKKIEKKEQASDL